MVKIENLKVVILAGGKGTRLKEHTTSIPKPMVKVSGKPIILHIIEHYKKFGIKSFIIASGYKSKIIKDFFKNNKNIKVVYTGKNTLTGGRLKKLKKYVSDTFFLTYGDGLSDINISSLLKFHIKHKKIATITAVHPISRFGEITLSTQNTVLKFNEKPQVKNDWINGGFFVFDKAIFKYLRRDDEILEKYPLQKLSKIRELKAYKHKKFWHCIDTIRDIEAVTYLLKNVKK